MPGTNTDINSSNNISENYLSKYIFIAYSNRSQVSKDLESKIYSLFREKSALE